MTQAECCDELFRLEEFTRCRYKKDNSKSYLAG